jgi:hypothetical protein
MRNGIRAQINGVHAKKRLSVLIWQLIITRAQRLSAIALTALRFAVMLSIINCLDLLANFDNCSATLELMRSEQWRTQFLCRL